MRTHLLALGLAAAACATPEASLKAEAAAPAPAEPRRFSVSTEKPMPPGLAEAALDVAQDPCADFYAHACGGWLATAQVPADRASTSRGFDAVEDRTEQVLKGILEEAAAGKLPKGTPFAQKLGDWYATCTDEAKLEKALPEVQRFLARTLQVKTPRELARTVGALHQQGLAPFFDVEAAQDLKDASQVVLALDQGGLGLPEREYYLDASAPRQALREAYQAHLAAQLKAAGVKDAAKVAPAVLALETRLAKASLSLVERRDPQKLYHRLDRAGLKKEAPGFAWDDYLQALGLKPAQKAVNVTSVAYVKELGAVAKETPPATLKAYLTWVVVRSATQALPRAFRDAEHAFGSKHFTGATQEEPRWRRCVRSADRELGEALGREYVRRAFPEEARARAVALMEGVQATAAERLKAAAWMDDATRAAAEVKLKAMLAKVGAPVAWRDYGPLKVARTSYFENALAAGRFWAARQVAKVGKPPERSEWPYSPATVNATYDSQLNQMVLPAGILQPPFFDPAASEAVNYGAIGMVVGHELTHGFDDEGRQFDAEGNLKDWWSEASAQGFAQRLQCVQAQFDAARGADGQAVAGERTQGENLADLGGIALAHAAMVEAYVKKPVGEAQAYRYTPSQQFFLGLAQAWCSKDRPEQARLKAAVDVHAPDALRINGPLSNLPAFRAAFQCADGAPMVRKDRCAVW